MAAKRNDLPEIVQTANRLLLEVERQVQRFPKLHKYRTGERLIDQAFEIANVAYATWTDREKRSGLEDLDAAIRRFKITLQLAGKLQAPPKPTAEIIAVLPKLADLPKEAEQEARTTEDLRRELATIRRELTLAKRQQPKAAPAPKVDPTVARATTATIARRREQASA